MSAPPPLPDLTDLAEVLDGAREAHRRLAATVAGVTSEQARRPSRLPGWSVGHVLTHLARNADSHVRALDGTRRGEVVERYPGGVDQRDREIEQGSGRGAPELVADVADSTARLEAAWAAMTPDAWSAPGSLGGRPEPVADLPFKRWREVEVHRVDLDLGPTWEGWPAGYVRRELHLATMAWRARQAMGLTELPAAALCLAPTERLAWLLGRLEVPGLTPPPPWW